MVATGAAVTAGPAVTAEPAVVATVSSSPHAAATSARTARSTAARHPKPLIRVLIVYLLSRLPNASFQKDSGADDSPFRYYAAKAGTLQGMVACSDEHGPCQPIPKGGWDWAPQGLPCRIRANYRKHDGVRFRLSSTSTIRRSGRSSVTSTTRILRRCRRIDIASGSHRSPSPARRHVHSPSIEGLQPSSGDYTHPSQAASSPRSHAVSIVYGGLTCEMLPHPVGPNAGKEYRAKGHPVCWTRPQTVGRSPLEASIAARRPTECPGRPREHTGPPERIPFIEQGRLGREDPQTSARGIGRVRAVHRLGSAY